MLVKVAKFNDIIMVYWWYDYDVLGIVGEHIGKIYLETKELSTFYYRKILKQIISEKNEKGINI